MSNTKRIAYLGMFIALEVILTRFLSIQTPFLRIGFSFVPIAISAMLLGPVYGGMIAAMGDLIGMLLFPSGGAYFPGFTLSAALTAVVYGACLYRKQKDFVHIGLAVLVVCVIINLGLDTYWLQIITGKGILALMPARVMKCLLMIPIQVSVIGACWRVFGRRLETDTAPLKQAI